LKLCGGTENWARFWVTGTMSDGFQRKSRDFQEREAMWAKSLRWKMSLTSEWRVKKLAELEQKKVWSWSYHRSHQMWPRDFTCARKRKMEALPTY
jgi:hypothetical protein